MGSCNPDCAWISWRSAASSSLPNRIISLWITENVNNLWQYNDYTKFPSSFFNSKSISNYLALPLAKAYLIWGAWNNGSEKSFYDRFVAKLSNHKPNFFRHNLCSFQFSKSLENFHWGRIGFYEMQVKLLLWKCRCLPVTGQPSQGGVPSVESGPRRTVPFPTSFFFLHFFLFPFLSRTRNGSKKRAESPSICYFLCKPILKDQTEFKLCIQKTKKTVTVWSDCTSLIVMINSVYTYIK